MIPLTRGYSTIVDADIDPNILRYKWYAKIGHAVYAARTTSVYCNKIRSVKCFYIHRVIMNAPPDMTVDHIDGDSLNNRRENLELVSREENLTRMHSRNGFEYMKLRAVVNRPFV